MIKNIQALRGVAALLVVFDHLGFAQHAVAPNQILFPILGTGSGAMGVDIFFVISGYVISMAATKREHFALGFFLARLARVAPLYSVLTIFKILGDTALHNSTSFPSFWNGFFYLPLFDREHYTSPPLGMGWTLSYEMWFYTVFAVMIGCFSVRRAVILLPIFFGLGAIVMSFFRAPFFFPFFMFHPFVVEFSLGCLIFIFQGRLGRNFSIGLAVAGMLSLIMLRLEPISDPARVLNYPVSWAWLRVAVWGLPAALLAAGCVGIERTTGLVFPRWLVGIGTISYSIYLTHGFTPRLIAAGFRVLHSSNSIAACFAMMILSVMVGYACWRWIERPLTLGAQGWVSRRWHVPIQEVTTSPRG